MYYTRCNTENEITTSHVRSKSSDCNETIKTSSLEINENKDMINNKSHCE